MREKKAPQGIKIDRTRARLISGSDDPDFALNLARQVSAAHRCEISGSNEFQVNPALAAMGQMKPRDAIEGMLMAQLIAAHEAAMECYRRGMIPDQTFEGRRENLNQANKLSRTYAALTDTLNRHRGKGQQRITVEHVNVHAGGQAIVGASPRGMEAVEDRGNKPVPHEKLPTTWHPDAEPGPAVGDRANRRRCTENAGGECMVVQLEAARQSATPNVPAAAHSITSSARPRIAGGIDAALHGSRRRGSTTRCEPRPNSCSRRSGPGASQQHVAKTTPNDRRPPRHRAVAAR